MLQVPDSTLTALERVEKLLETTLQDGTRVGAGARRTIGAGGKRLRPLLVLLSYQCAGGRVGSRVLRVAAAVELLHTASLIHDDIIDGAKLRRGEPTVAADEGDSRAIVVGDYMFVKGYALAASVLDATTVDGIARACTGLAEGQYAEEDFADGPPDVHDYLRVVEQKTATFIAGCAELGANLAGLRGDMARPFYDFGFNLGVAFQLIDDVLDATGTVEKLGKDVGVDVRNGARGGPVVFSGEGGSLVAKQMLQQLRQVKGVDETRRHAEAYASQAEAAAGRLPNNEFGTTLTSVARVLLHRQS